MNPFDDFHCPRCGTVQRLGAIGGLCAGCLAKGGQQHWLADAPPPESAGEPVLTGWQIVGTLGAGGMGRVFRAVQEDDGSPAAVKVLDAAWARDPLMAARFENEAAALRELHHPNIVRLLQTAEAADGRLCLIMEVVEGCDLGRLLRAQSLPQRRAVEIFRKCCDAVEYAHARGFIHRDIKPSNILIGPDGVVKLADFGLAKHAGAVAMALSGLTATTDQFGTAYYLAPERMAGGAAGDERMDVYSLGVLLYHLLAGRMPLGRFTPVSQITGLPSSLDAVVAKALEADPAKRTASVALLRRQFDAAWKQWLSGRSRARTVRRAAAVAAGVLLTAAAVTGGAYWQHRRMRPPSTAAFVHPSAASETRPWENGLGMKFVPVPGTRVLFSVWETRRRDFEPYRVADRGSISAWRSDNLKVIRAAEEHITTFAENGTIVHNATWDNPGWPVTPDHPAGGIHIRDAQMFCLWLTWREHGEGRLPPGWLYRLPTSAEWLAAVGGENAPVRPGNVAGLEVRELPVWPRGRPTMPTADPFQRLAPAGSFPPETFGLFDMSGNVAEWVLDKDEPTHLRPVKSQAQLRGPACTDGSPETVSFAYVRPPMRQLRVGTFGFRIVLDPFGSTPAAPDPPWADGASKPVGRCPGSVEKCPSLRFLACRGGWISHHARR